MQGQGQLAYLSVTCFCQALQLSIMLYTAPGLNVLIQLAKPTPALVSGFRMNKIFAIAG